MALQMYSRDFFSTISAFKLSAGFWSIQFFAIFTPMSWDELHLLPFSCRLKIYHQLRHPFAVTHQWKVRFEKQRWNGVKLLFDDVCVTREEVHVPHSASSNQRASAFYLFLFTHTHTQRIKVCYGK